MAQKNRNNITRAVNQNIYDNKNKAILAKMVRSVLDDYRDSFFNLIDDRLKNLRYNEHQTLEHVINSSANVPPLWGSTDYFDPNTGDGEIESYSDNGIVSDMTYRRLSGHDCEVTINFRLSIARRKISVSIWRNNENANRDNDFCAPCTTQISSTQIRVALRRIARDPQKIRLEILAFTVATS